MTNQPLESDEPLRPRRGSPHSLLIGAAVGGLSLAGLLAFQLIESLSLSWSSGVAVDATSSAVFGAVLGWVTWATRKWKAAPAIAAAVIAGVLTPVLLVMTITFIHTCVTGHGARGNFAGHLGAPVAPMSLEAAANALNNAVLAAVFIGIFLVPAGGAMGVAAGVAGRFQRI